LRPLSELSRKSIHGTGDVLLTPERERVVRLLIERIGYSGATEELRFTFSAAGASMLAAETSA